MRGTDQVGLMEVQLNLVTSFKMINLLSSYLYLLFSHTYIDWRQRRFCNRNMLAWLWKIFWVIFHRLMTPTVLNSSDFYLLSSALTIFSSNLTNDQPLLIKSNFDWKALGKLPGGVSITGLRPVPLSKGPIYWRKGHTYRHYWIMKRIINSIISHLDQSINTRPTPPLRSCALE